jgi:hypothetical protein
VALVNPRTLDLRSATAVLTTRFLLFLAEAQTFFASTPPPVIAKTLRGWNTIRAGVGAGSGSKGRRAAMIDGPVVFGGASGRCRAFEKKSWGLELPAGKHWGLKNFWHMDALDIVNGTSTI